MAKSKSELMVDDDQELDVEDAPEEDDVSVTFDIASYPSDLTLSVVYEMWKAGDISIPDFQRNFVWTIKQSSRLIESFLLGLPVPQIFFYVDDDNKSLVIDGQQRIMSVVYYLDGYFGSESIHGKKQVFRLNLGQDNGFHRKRFDDLTSAQQRKLKASILRAINIRQLDPSGGATSIYYIFERLNTGGTPLKPQEIRNVVYRGNLVGVLRELNEHPAWRRILGKATLDRHQKDVELVLRIFALTHFFGAYEKPMKHFLSRVMEQERSASSLKVKRFHRGFPRVADFIHRELGDKPFHLRGRLNSSALDAVFATLLRAPGELPNDLRSRYDRLKADKAFNDTTFYSTSDVSVVHDRFKVTQSYLVDG